MGQIVIPSTYYNNGFCHMCTYNAWLILKSNHQYSGQLYSCPVFFVPFDQFKEVQ